MKRIFFLLNLIILTSKAIYWLNEGFKINKVFIGRSQPISYVSFEKPDFDSIFSQEFKYLTKGKQTYVFESNDHQYILKCFQMNQMNPPFWTRIFRNENPKKKRMKEWMDSYRIADEKLREEAGILYVHLRATDDLKQNVTLMNKLGSKKSVSLDEIGFMLQKKFEPLEEKMIACRNQSDFKQVRDYIKGFIQTISERYRKGILNHDQFILRDLGILDGRIIEFDMGQFYTDEDLKDIDGFKKKIFHCTKPFREWISHEIPEVVVYLDDEIHRVVKEYHSSEL